MQLATCCDAHKHSVIRPCLHSSVYLYWNCISFAYEELCSTCPSLQHLLSDEGSRSSLACKKLGCNCPPWLWPACTWTACTSSTAQALCCTCLPLHPCSRPYRPLILWAYWTCCFTRLLSYQLMCICWTGASSARSVPRHTCHRLQEASRGIQDRGCPAGSRALGRPPSALSLARDVFGSLSPPLPPVHLPNVRRCCVILVGALVR